MAYRGFKDDKANKDLPLEEDASVAMDVAEEGAIPTFLVKDEEASRYHEDRYIVCEMEELQAQIEQYPGRCRVIIDYDTVALGEDAAEEKFNRELRAFLEYAARSEKISTISLYNVDLTGLELPAAALLANPACTSFDFESSHYDEVAFLGALIANLRARPVVVQELNLRGLLAAQENMISEEIMCELVRTKKIQKLELGELMSPVEGLDIEEEPAEMEEEPEAEPAEEEIEEEGFSLRKLAEYGDRRQCVLTNRFFAEVLAGKTLQSIKIELSKAQLYEHLLYRLCALFADKKGEIPLNLVRRAIFAACDGDLSLCKRVLRDPSAHGNVIERAYAMATPSYPMNAMKIYYDLQAFQLVRAAALAIDQGQAGIAEGAHNNAMAFYPGQDPDQADKAEQADRDDKAPGQ